MIMNWDDRNNTIILFEPNLEEAKEFKASVHSKWICSMPTFLDLDSLDSEMILAYADCTATPFLLVFALTKEVVRIK